jgi:hypothetical protein
MTKLTKEQIKRQKALAWLKRIAYENPCMKEVKTCIEVLSATAQPVMPVRREPISFDALMAAVSEVTGAKSEFDATPEKCYQAVPFMNFNSLSRIVEMFRTAQPVIPDNDAGDLIQRLSGRAQFLRDKGEVKTPELIEAAISALSAQPVSEPYKLPDGWKLVPIEPTAAMFHAFNDCDYGRKSMRERYIQMIEAAPAQESE